MYNYYVIEIQTNQDSSANLVTGFVDKDTAEDAFCQAVMAARKGAKLAMPLSAQGCMVGAATLGMTEKGEKVKSGEFHAGIGIHKSPAEAAEMIATVTDIDYPTDGEVVCPLKDADFVPDVVAV